jgi:hypothetical protein
MSDIVERLRTRDAHLSLDEAADEIERLRELLRETVDREREEWGMTDFVLRAEAALGTTVQPSG